MQSVQTFGHPDREGVVSSFGGPAALVRELPSAHVVELYRKKCGVDIGRCFHDRASITLYRCGRTGYHFWRPAEVAGDEAFYAELSAAWPWYYRTERWEYPAARSALRRCRHVLEIGSGRGYFLRSLEGKVESATGLELNRTAIAEKVTTFPIEASTVEAARDRGNARFDAVCSFQVLEHVTSPASFVEAALGCLVPGGLLVLSTPNYQYEPHLRQLDAFDLPPHHVNHFDESSFRKIAEVYGLEVVKIVSQPRGHTAAEDVRESTRGRLVYKAARAVSSVAHALAYRLCREPGANVLVVLRKPPAA